MHCRNCALEWNNKCGKLHFKECLITGIITEEEMYISFLVYFIGLWKLIKTYDCVTVQFKIEFVELLLVHSNWNFHTSVNDVAIHISVQYLVNYSATYPCKHLWTSHFGLATMHSLWLVSAMFNERIKKLKSGTCTCKSYRSIISHDGLLWLVDAP